MHLDMVFKAFVAILAAVIIIGSGLGVTSGFAQVVAADNYLESAAKIILESNYNAEVISKCMEEAELNGYTLQVDVSRSIKAGVRNYASLQITYYFEIPLFGIKQEKMQMKMI